MNALYFFLSFVLGFLVKYCDRTYSKRALFVSLITLAIGIYLSTFYEGFLIFFSIVVGVFIAGKIDTLHFDIAGVGYGIYSAYYIFKNGFPWISIAIIAAGIVDEVGNDMVDAKKLKLLSKFFEKRLFMDIACFAMALLSIIPWLSFLLLVCFDVGYQLETKLKL